MKLKDLLPIPIILISMVIASCSKEESNATNETDPLDNDAIKSAMANGSWQISYYYDTDTEETAEFMGFVFTFNADGILNATDGNTALSGAWSIEDSDNDTADTMDDYTEFNILFSSPPKFTDLSDDWEIKSYSANKIELIDVSGGNGGTDYLTFEKI
ncbi:MAG: hypothetical protein WBN39_14615 [Flavobacteriaceae bacterium]